jgi:hypothetical protein
MFSTSPPAQALSLSVFIATIPRTFYRNNPKDILTFDDAVNIMVKHYNTPERQARVHTYLTSLRFTSFRFDEKLDASRTLTVLTSEI